MNKLKLLNKMLADYTYQIRQNKARALPFISTIFAAIEKSSFTDGELKSLKDFFREAVQIFPTSSELLSTYDLVRPKFIFSKIYPLLLEKRLKNHLIVSYISLLKMRSDQNKSPLSEDQTIKLLRTIKVYSSEFVNEYDTVKKAIEDIFYEYQYLKIFRSTKDQEEFITDKAVNNFIDTINNEDLSQGLILKKFELLFNLKVEDKLELVFAKFNEIIQSESAEPVRDLKIQLASKILRIFVKFKKEINKLPDKTKVGEISSGIINWYSQDENWNHRASYLRLIGELKNIQDNPSSANLDIQVRNFMANAQIEAYQMLGQTYVESLVSQYPEEFMNAATKNLDILNLGLGGLDQAKYPNLVTNLINETRSFTKPDQKKPYFDIIAKLKCAKDPNIVNLFYSELMAIKPADPSFVKQYINKDRGQLFNAAQKRDLKAS